MPQDGRVALVQLSNGSRVVLAQVSAMSGSFILPSNETASIERTRRVSPEFPAKLKVRRCPMPLLKPVQTHFRPSLRIPPLSR